MTTVARVAIGLWAVLALVVFSVTFDWQTRKAGLLFASHQVQRHAAGLPVATITEGFRPMVRSAALRSSAWLGLSLITGVIATVAASRASKQ
ncbi:MAG: hypothetical protein EXQ50_01255 [Acidobacteria bacterium]|nr:hypothetical protein [Acidobacteriota bacterium]MSO60714.1 hypothetical protein [Acidobacteriota bacterium]